MASCVRACTAHCCASSCVQPHVTLARHLRADSECRCSIWVVTAAVSMFDSNWNPMLHVQFICLSWSMLNLSNGLLPSEMFVMADRLRGGGVFGCEYSNPGGTFFKVFLSL